VGGWAQVLSGHPFDTVKVRLQTQGHPPKFSGGWHCARLTLKEEGLRGLYKGVNSPLMGVGICNAVLFSANGNFRRLLHKDSAIPLSLTQIGVAGALSGGVMSLLNCPVELLKVRLQVQYTQSAALAADVSKAVGAGVSPILNTTASGIGGAGVVLDKAGASVRNMSTLPTAKAYKGVLDCGVRTYRESGVVGLFRGITPTLFRDIPSFAAYFVSYEVIKNGAAALHGSPEPVVADMLFAGGCAGIAAWLTCYPQDMIKSRMQSDARYKTTVECIRALAKESNGGIKVFFRGFGPTMARAFPANAATFLAYEMTMNLFQ